MEHGHVKPFCKSSWRISGLDSEHSVDYSDKEIILHLIHASTSQTSVTQVSNNCPDVPSEDAIRNRLKNSGEEDVQPAINQMMKDKVIETLPGSVDLCHWFCFHTFLWKGRKRWKHN